MAVLNAASRLALAGLMAAAVALAAPPPALADTTLETAVKANFLYKFGPFVEWPPRAFPAPNSPLVICLAGEDPFGSVLDDAVRGQAMAGRPVIVRRLTSTQAVGACHILFVGRSKGQGEAFLKAALGQPVLTVTDQSRGVSGGIIQFVLKDGRVRFDIDADAAQAAGIPISSKLLGLAVSVRRTAR